MEQIDFGIFPAEDALEMILVFDGKGTIIYANAVAREKLGYGDDICGISVGSVFPNSFKSTGDGFETEYLFGNKMQNLMAYRKNLTCFPVEVQILRMTGTACTYARQMIY